ncbi:hypothetical protein BDQ17DRAFT_1273604 [Cyathus striatus]|nr:hypothetical protein BDQ17DRAFT_1273604 [Cyathus striatus]
MEYMLQRYPGTNYVPSIGETRQIKDLLEAADNNIHEIEVEIDHLRRRLDLLQEERAKIVGIAKQYRSLISPARRLGRDILEEIFLACLPVDRNPCMSIAEAPMLLTHICNSWRNIAHSVPRLWSAIHIVLPNTLLDKYPPESSILYQEDFVSLKLDQRKAAAKEWLDRSAARPLSISVYQKPGLGGVESSKYKIRQLHLSFIIGSFRLFDLSTTHCRTAYRVEFRIGCIGPFKVYKLGRFFIRHAPILQIFKNNKTKCQACSFWKLCPMAIKYTIHHPSLFRNPKPLSPPKA